MRRATWEVGRGASCSSSGLQIKENGGDFTESPRHSSKMLRGGEALRRAAFRGGMEVGQTSKGLGKQADLTKAVSVLGTVSPYI